MKSHLIKIGLLVIFIILFYWIGGFEPPKNDPFGSRGRRGGSIFELWMSSVMLYFIGSYALLWGDKKVGVVRSYIFSFFLYN
jgi:hypothetical protein